MLLKNWLTCYSHLLIIDCFVRRFIFSLLLCTTILTDGFSQEVDLVRLYYSRDEIVSDQISMAVSSNGRFIAFAYRDKTIKIFDVTANRFIKKFEGPYTALFDMQITSTGRIALAWQRELQVWDWRQEKMIKTFSLQEPVTKTTFSGTTNFFAIGQMGGITSIFDLNKVELIRDITIDRHHVGALAFHPNGKDIAIGVLARIQFQPSPLVLHDIRTGEEKAKSTDTGYFTMVAFNENGSEIMTAGLTGSTTKKFLKILDGSTLALKKNLDTEINLMSSLLPYGGLYTGGKLLSITLSQSFNVNDAATGDIVFTTKSERVKIPPVWKFGVGTYTIFPLDNKGERVLINASKDNINQIYDSKANAIIGYFFSDSNDDFAVIARDGRVDGTPDALSKLFWTSRNWTTRNSSAKTSLESTFEKGFTPKLLSEIFTENALKQTTFEVDEVISKIPVLTIGSINGKPVVANSVSEAKLKSSKIEIRSVENGGEITEVKLYQNSKLVKSLPKSNTNSYVFDVTLISSFGEDNYFYVTAGSKSGIDAEKVKFTIAYKGLTEEQPRLFMLTIGINNYKNSKYNLNYAQADADGVDKAIRQSSASLFKEIIPYTIRNDKATKATILAAFEEIKKKALEQDVLLVYYAGHGVMTDNANGNGEFYVVPHDIIQLYGRDDILKDKGVSATTLKKYSSEINAQKQIFILDACQSASALESVAVRGAGEEKAIAQLARSTGTFWITATGSNQFASEFVKLGHGIFTYSLLEGIKGAADTNGDNKLTVRELSTFIENKVPELSEQLKGSPQFPSAYSFGNDFPIVLYQR